MEELRRTNQSRWPIQETAATSRRRGFWDGRPSDQPKPSVEFHLDYDFGKSDVEAVSDCFDLSFWQTSETIGTWVHRWAPLVTNMNDLGGRQRIHDRMDYMNERYHTYGQQLGWHGLMATAGEYLAKHPVSRRQYDSEDPWKDWLRREVLTRSDDLWLADGIDDTPLETQETLCEREGGSLVITGNRAKLLSLVGLVDSEESVPHEVVVGGDWKSHDGINVHVTSALATAGHGDHIAGKLAKDDGFTASLPVVRPGEEADVATDSDRESLIPWTVWPVGDVHLDGTDILGATSVASRLGLTPQVLKLCDLKPADSFGRNWKRADGAVWVRSEAWGIGMHYPSQERSSGRRLTCRREILQEVLANQGLELVVLIVLRRYEEVASQFWHTTAAIRVNSQLAVSFHQGLVNQPHKHQW